MSETTEYRPVRFGWYHEESTFLRRVYRQEQWLLYFDGGWQVKRRSRSKWCGPWGEWEMIDS